MKNGGLILWSAIAICDMSETSWQTACEQGVGAEEKSVHCGAGEQRQQEGHVGGERIVAC